MTDDSEEDIEFDFSEIKNKLKGWLKPKKPSSAKPKESSDDDELDFSDAIKFLKENKKVLSIAGVVAIILVGVWIRTLSLPNYEGRLLGLDPYAFHRYARMIVENGTLPAVDEGRYFPNGFLTFREHQVSTYFIAGMYLTLSPILGGELMDYSIIYPVISFAISMIVFYLMVKEIFNKETALIATAFLAFAPSYLFRTIAGFADKEALAMAFWFSMIYALIKSAKAKDVKKVLIYGLISGLLGGMSSLTWGGANFLFYSIALTFALLALMNRLNNKRVITFFTWYIPMMIMSATLTLRYGGLGLITQEMFLLPTITAGLIILKIIAYELYINKLKKKVLPDSYYFGIIVLVISVIAIPVMQLTGIFDFAGKLNTVIETIIHPFGTCPFCVSVTENQAPYFIDPQRNVDWWSRLQWFIPLFIIGAILLVWQMHSKFKKKAIPIIIAYAIFMLFFMFSNFVNDAKYEAANLFFASTYLYTLPLLGLTMILFFAKHPKSKAWDETTVERLLIISWFSLSVIATRGAIRIIFASTPIYVLMAAYAVIKIKELVQKKTKDAIYSNVPLIIAALIIYWAFSITSASAGGYWPSFTDNWNTTMNWVKDNTPQDAVFTHWWDYGYWVQTMGERATTVDGGNFRVDWDEIIGGQTFSGYNLTEVYHSLNYFKQNDTTGKRPDYLLIIDDDVLKYVQMANIGGRPGHYSPFVYSQRVENTMYQTEDYSTMLVFTPATGPGIIGSDVIIGENLFSKDQSYVVNIAVPMNDAQEFGQPVAVLYNVFTGQSIGLPYTCVCDMSLGCVDYNLTQGIPDCIEFIQGGVLHIPSHLRNRLMTQLYLLNKTIPGFNLVYDSPGELNMQNIVAQYDPTDLKIYQIDYEELEKWVDNGTPAW